MGGDNSKMSYEQQSNPQPAPGTVDVSATITKTFLTRAFDGQTEGPTSEFVKSTTTVGVEALKPGERYTVDDAIDQIGAALTKNTSTASPMLSTPCLSPEPLPSCP